MIPIQRPPYALPGLLNTKQLGRNPAQIDDVVRGTVNLNTHYLYGQRPEEAEGYITSSGSLSGFYIMNGAATRPNIIVPEGVIRVMRSLSLLIIGTPNSTVRAQVCMVSPLKVGAYLPLVMAPESPTGMLTSQPAAIASVRPVDLANLWFLPGSAAALLVSNDATGILYYVRASWWDLAV